MAFGPFILLMVYRAGVSCGVVAPMHPTPGKFPSWMSCMMTDLDIGDSCKGSGSPGNDESLYARYSNPSKKRQRIEPDEV